MSAKQPFRRRREETEDDLLREMEAFNQSSSSIKPENLIKIEKSKKSVFAKSRAKKQSTKTDDKGEPEAKRSAVVQAVVQERSTANFEVKPPSSSDIASSLPFPQPARRPQTSTTSGEKKSLFAQQVMSHVQSGPSHEEVIFEQPRHRRSFQQSRFIAESGVLSDKDKQEIHLENVAKLDARTDEQLKMDREEIMRGLKPGLLEFLKKRGASKTANADQVQVQESMETLHMDVDVAALKPLEEDKMKWMGEVEAPEALPKDFSARFDLSGNLLPYAAHEIPVNTGLHHHGEEPHRPGYTIEELLTLARSTNDQQRSIGFSTLAKIIHEEKMGKFEECFEQKSILSELLKCDILPLLRIGMDNSNLTGFVTHCYECMASLLWNEAEEGALDYQFFSQNGGPCQPCLLPKISRTKEFQEEVHELKDIEVLRADVVAGLLRTNILERFAYVIKVDKPNTQVIIAILKILIRMARHSLSTATVLINHKSLLDAIINCFLPTKPFSDSMNNSVYDTPVHYALKLLRILASWGRSMAKSIVAKYDLGSQILCYISGEPGSSLVQESLRLIIEAGRTWITLLRYGISVDKFAEFHPVIMRHLVYMNAHLDVETAEKFDCHFATVVLNVIGTAVNCTPNTEETFREEQENACDLVDWNLVMSLFEPVELLMKKWCAQVRDVNAVKFHCLDLMSAILGTFASVIRRQSKSSAFDPTLFLARLEETVNDCLKGLLDCELYKTLLNSALQSSVFNSDRQVSRTRDPDSLPTLGLVGSSVSDIALGTFHHLYSLTKAILAAKECQPRLCNNFTNPEVSRYLAMVREFKTGNLKERWSNSNWFCKDEIGFLNALLMAKTSETSEGRKQILTCALVLSTHYQKGEEHRLKDLQDKIIFHPDFVDFLSQDQLLNIRDLYQKCLLDKKALDNAKILCRQLPFSTSSLNLDHAGETILPEDWQFVPLLRLMNKRKEESVDSSEEDRDEVRKCLTWVQALNKLQGGIGSPVFCYSRLMAVFLASSDLFLDPEIHKLSESILDDIVAKKKMLRFKDEDLPGIDSFQDYYKELVEHFQAVSYGNKLFAKLLLVPQLKQNDWRLKMVMWSDNFDCLRSITLDTSDLFQNIETEDFLEDNNNEDLIRAYLKALMTGQVTKPRNPLLYKIASSNISVCLNSKDSQIKQEILDILSNSGKAELLKDLTQ